MFTHTRASASATFSSSPTRTSRNAFYALLPLPPSLGFQDYATHIDVVTGRTRAYTRFIDRLGHTIKLLGQDEKLGLGYDELVLVLGAMTLDTPVLIMSLLAIGQPFLCSSGGEGWTDVLARGVTRIFVNNMEGGVSLKQVIKAVSESSYAPAKIYIVGGYSTEWYPTLHGMIEYSRKRERRRFKRDDLAGMVTEVRTGDVAYLEERTGVAVTHGEILERFAGVFPRHTNDSKTEPIRIRSGIQPETVPIVLMYDPLAVLDPPPLYAFPTSEFPTSYLSLSSAPLPQRIQSPYSTLIMPLFSLGAILGHGVSPSHLRIGAGAVSAWLRASVRLGGGVRVVEVVRGVGESRVKGRSQENERENVRFESDVDVNMKALQKLLPKGCLLVDGDMIEGGTGALWMGEGDGEDVVKDDDGRHAKL